MIHAFIELNRDTIIMFLGLVMLILLVALQLSLIYFMRGSKKRTVKTVKVSAKPSKYADGLTVVAGNGATAELLIKKLCAKDKRVVHIGDKRSGVVSKKLSFIEGSLNGNALESFGFFNGAHSITVFCAYENDNENLNAALILNGALESCASDSGERRVKISYKNIAKTQFYKSLDSRITYFNTDELTARSFVEKYNLADYIPKSAEPATETNESTENGGTESETKNDAEKSDATANGATASAVTSGGGKTPIAIDYTKNKKALKARGGNEKPFSVSRIFVGFSSLNSEILEKLVFSESLCEECLNAVVFDKNADTVLPAFYNRENDVLDVEHITAKNGLHPSKMIALKIDAEAFELYDKIRSLCKAEDFCAIYIDIGCSVQNTETALELRDTLIKDDVAKKAVIFAYNDSEDFIKGCHALNSGCKDFERIIFFGASDNIDI